MSLVIVTFEPELPKWYIRLKCTCQCAVSIKMITQILRIATFCIFIWATVTITWQSVMAFLVFIGALFLPDYKDMERRNQMMDEKGDNSNPLKGKSRTAEKDLPQELLHDMEHNICKFVTYNAEDVDAVYNFEIIKNQTECIFAKRAKLWGSPDWKGELNLEENVLRSIPTFYKFTTLCDVLGLDGFVYELPSDMYGSDIDGFADSVCKLLTTLSDNDPIEVHCMDKSYVGNRGWVFEFNNKTFFITTFAPFYPADHSRYSFGSAHCYVLLQPEITFAQYDLDSDTPITDWENPKTQRDKIRCAYRKAGRSYPIRETVNYPMAHDIVRPISYNGAVVEWWTSIKNMQCNLYNNCRLRTHSSSL